MLYRKYPRSMEEREGDCVWGKENHWEVMFVLGCCWRWKRGCHRERGKGYTARKVEDVRGAGIISFEKYFFLSFGCPLAFSSCGDQELLFIAVHRLLIVCCGAWSPGVEASVAAVRVVSVVWHTGLFALWHVGSSPARDQTHVPSLGRQILNHWTTRKVQGVISYPYQNSCVPGT